MYDMMKQGYVGNPNQLCSVRRVRLQEGNGKGTEVIEVFTAKGLQVDILPDTGLDIGQVRYQGINMTFISKNGYDSPATFLPYETEFSHTFPVDCSIPAACAAQVPPTGTGTSGTPSMADTTDCRRNRSVRRSTMAKSLSKAPSGKHHCSAMCWN